MARRFVAGFWLNRLGSPERDLLQERNEENQGCCCVLIQTILHPVVLRVLALLLFALTLWGVIYSLAPKEVAPDGQLFVLAVLSIAAHIAGWLISFIKLPPLLGMMLMGILLRNIGFAEFKGQYVTLEGILRNVALMIILTRAGLGLDPSALRRLSLIVARLAVIPSIVEIVVSAVVSHFLFNLQWIWSFLLGSVLAAVSPAVVIPCLFSLQAQGYGLNKGIPTLIIAAASFDDILGISIFRIILSAIFAAGNLVDKILEGPLGVIFGISFGLAWGFIVGYIPQQEDAFVVALRTLLVAAGGLLAIFGSNAIGYDGAGPLGCVVAAFVARQIWRKQGWTNNNNPVGNNFQVLWTIFQPILFGLIGAAINLKILEPRTVGLGVACLFAAILLRLVVSVIIASGANLNWKEKTFVAMAWFPKATVQAAIGPIALDMARTPDEVTNATIILIIAVLSILLTAPLGAILITLVGPLLLTKTEEGATSSSINIVEEQPIMAGTSRQNYSTFDDDDDDDTCECDNILVP